MPLPWRTDGAPAFPGPPREVRVRLADLALPWDRLAEWQPFVGHRPRPAGAGFYPEDLTREALESWLEVFTPEPYVLRDPALLKLFFGADAHALAEGQLATFVGVTGAHLPTGGALRASRVRLADCAVDGR